MYYLAKVSFNSQGWIFPSGMAGKITESFGSHYETLYGFGWEEWNFNPNRNYDGWNFGFLQGLNSNNFSYFSEKEHSDLFLFTQTGGKYYIVAYIESFIVPTYPKRENARLNLDKKMMKNQVNEVGGNLKQFDKDFINCVNFAFKNYKILYNDSKKDIFKFSPPARMTNFKDIHKISDPKKINQLNAYKK
jgi:hypothetical protein